MSVNQFPITAAQLSGNFCETLFYGMYLVTCCICARTLLITGSGQEERWLRLHEIRWIMASVAIALFIVCTFDVAIGLLHNFHAFIRAKDPTVELNNIADWINIARVRHLTHFFFPSARILIGFHRLVCEPSRRHDSWWLRSCKSRCFFHLSRSMMYLSLYRYIDVGSCMDVVGWLSSHPFSYTSVQLQWQSNWSKSRLVRLPWEQ